MGPVRNVQWHPLVGVSLNDISVSNCMAFGIYKLAKADQQPFSSAASIIRPHTSFLSKTCQGLYFITVRPEFIEVIRAQNPNSIRASEINGERTEEKQQ